MTIPYLEVSTTRFSQPPNFSVKYLILFLQAFPAGADLLVHHISAGMPPMSP